MTSPSGPLALAFLDPEGFEVHFATLRVLARRPVDILYLFPSGIGIKRNLPQFIRSTGERMDRFWEAQNGASCRWHASQLG